VAALDPIYEAPVKQITAAQVMTRQVLTVRADWPVNRLVKFLVDHSISGAPVVSEQEVPIGVVSLTDVARNGEFVKRNQSEVHAFYRHGLERIVGREELGAFRVEVESHTTVREIMTPVVFSVEQEATVQEVANTMITGRIHRVIVTGASRIVGIISSLDLLPVVRAM
jgi:CBS domain-containing protein